MDGMKYIVYERPFDGMEIPVLFPQFLKHDNVAHAITNSANLRSAGFVTLKRGEVQVSGKSTSLGLSSRSEDVDLIISHLTFKGI